MIGHYGHYLNSVAKLWIIALCVLFAPSHAFVSWSSISPQIVYVSALSALALISGMRVSSRHHSMLLLAVMLWMLLGAVGSFVAGSTQQLMMTIVGSANLFVVVSLVDTEEIDDRLLQFLSTVMIMGLAMSVIGFVIAQVGVGTIYKLENIENGQTLSLYYTTFTNSIEGRVIRPSFIYDEPGSLASLVSIVIVLLLLRESHSWRVIVLSTLNMITLSVMSLVTFLAVALLLIRQRQYRLWFAYGVVIILAITINMLIEGDIIQTYFSSRLVIENGLLRGDNRTTQVIEFFSIVNRDIVFNGADALGLINNGQSSNPFSILYSSGLFVWIPYVTIIVHIVTKAVRNPLSVRGICGWVLLVLFLHRPYIYSLFWGLSFMLAYVYYIKFQDTEMP